MFSKVFSASVLGVESFVVQVESDVHDGLPSFHIVGCPSLQVKEAQERVRSALNSVGALKSPKRVTINLAPAGVKKDGTALDLPMAVAVLSALRVIPKNRLESMMIVGELSLSGAVKQVSGVISAVIAARDAGLSMVIVPSENIEEASLVDGMIVNGVSSLKELILLFKNDSFNMQQSYIDKKIFGVSDYDIDFSDIQGQEFMKRAAVIAASGFHNLLMMGPPGAGKTMAARRIATILPPPDMDEALEITKIYSVAGLLSPKYPFIVQRPFRNPHHTLSAQALAGGGRSVRPGEITLAHRGVLFLDELPEFSRRTLEILRQPLEERCVRIARADWVYTFPADFMLVAAMNPCKCGYYPDRSKCSCTESDVLQYKNRISKALLDRIDLCVDVSAVTWEQLSGDTAAQKSNISSKDMRKQVLQAQKIQKERYKSERFYFNSQLPAAKIKKYCNLHPEADEMLRMAFSSMLLSARAYHRILRTARTIADLSGNEVIMPKDMAEALCYRIPDGNCE